MFSPEFINWLSTFRLPEYELNKVDSQYELHFHGAVEPHRDVGNPGTGDPEQAALACGDEGLGRFALDVLYARAKAKLWSRSRAAAPVAAPAAFRTLAPAATHIFLWQRWCVEASQGRPRPSVRHLERAAAMDNDLEAISTRAHELPMVAAALASSDEELRWAPYHIDQWRHTYGGNLLIALPDAFGTKSFCATRQMGRGLDRFSSRQRAADHRRRRHHQMVEAEGSRSREKLLVFSDGMDVGSIEKPIATLPAGSASKPAGVPISTNDFVGCAPDGSADPRPISIVCKVTSVDGKPAVKLSDNPEKGHRHPVRSRRRYLRVRQCRSRVRTAKCV